MRGKAESRYHNCTTTAATKGLIKQQNEEGGEEKRENKEHTHIDPPPAHIERRTQGVQGQTPIAFS